jgi:hypothetical protein
MPSVASPGAAIGNSTWIVAVAVAPGGLAAALPGIVGHVGRST